ncbi:MAG: hypothetical protein JSR39_05115 [Verrucomicrobia bacterium]|nr:hypothetical protein [Verrucomicrobiota bacterium]
MSVVFEGNCHVEKVKMSGMLSDDQMVVEYTYSDMDSLRQSIHNKMIGLIKLYSGADLHKLAAVPAVVDRLYVKGNVASEKELLALAQAWRVRILYYQTEVFQGCLEDEGIEMRRWQGPEFFYDELEGEDVEIVSFKPESMQNLLAEPIVANWEMASPMLEQLESVRNFTLSQMIVNYEDAGKIRGVFDHALDRFKLNGCHAEQGVVQNWVDRFAHSSVRTMMISSPPTEMTWEIDDMVQSRMNARLQVSAPTPSRWVFSHTSI